MLLIFISFPLLISINAMELNHDYVKWADSQLTRQCGESTKCDLRQQYCDSVMETCRPCTELCRSWDDADGWRICGEHCSVFLGYLVGSRQKKHLEEYAVKTLEASTFSNVKPNNAEFSNYYPVVQITCVVTFCIILSVIVAMVANCIQRRHLMAFVTVFDQKTDKWSADLQRVVQHFDLERSEVLPIKQSARCHYQSARMVENPYNNCSPPKYTSQCSSATLQDNMHNANEFAADANKCLRHDETAQSSTPLLSSSSTNTMPKSI